MSVDDYFSDPTEVELSIEDEGYKYDASYHVRVIVDSGDANVSVNVEDGFALIIEKLPFMEMEDDTDGCYRCSIHDTTQVRTKWMFRRLVGSILSLIDYGVKRGATVFIRIDEGTVAEESEIRMTFANVASTDVRINTKLLMGALKEMGVHRDIGVLVKVER